MSKLHAGPVVFRDGVHYAIGENGEADIHKPLRWTPEGYRAAEPGEPLHNETHFTTERELDFGGEG